MKTKEIYSLQKKARKEAQIEIDKIYKKYSKEINKAIREEIPKGQTLISGNGMCTLYDENDKKLKTGRIWGMGHSDKQLGFLSALQYERSLLV